jgi:hypothetical protein
VRWLAAVGLAALVVAAAADSASAASSGIVKTEVTLSPGPYVFGQRVTADVHVLVNRKLVDPKALQAQTRFFPYEFVVAPRRTETDDGSVTEVHYRYVLDCNTLECLTGGTLQRRIKFAPVRIRYRDRSRHTWSRSFEWPAIREISRVGNDEIRPPTATDARFSLPLDPLLQFPASVVAPSPNYRLSPLALGLLLIAFAAGALVATFFVAQPLVALVRRTRDAAGPELSPLEQALAEVEATASGQAGGAEHREALALLARELRRVQQPDLVHSARKLAWSEEAPSASASRNLVAEVRATAGGVG